MACRPPTRPGPPRQAPPQVDGALQRAQEQGLPPRAQLRARPEAPRRAAGVLQSPGVCDPHRMRACLRSLAARPRDAQATRPLFPEPARPDQLSRVLFLDRASRNPGPPQATTAPALTRSLQPPKNRPNPATSSLQTQTENCWFMVMLLTTASEKPPCGEGFRLPSCEGRAKPMSADCEYLLSRA